MMMITVHCDCEDCYCNEDGYCCADLGIYVNNMQECETYEPREGLESDKDE